jgi:hypothetical protein
LNLSAEPIVWPYLRLRRNAMACRVAISDDGAGCEGAIERRQIVRLEHDVQGPQVLGQPGASLMPTSGTISSPCASTHAIASCVGVNPLACAIRSRKETVSRFFVRFSPWKRGKVAVTRPGARPCFIEPVNRPCATTL